MEATQTRKRPSKNNDTVKIGKSFEKNDSKPLGPTEEKFTSK